MRVHVNVWAERQGRARSGAFGEQTDQGGVRLGVGAYRRITVAP